MDDKAVWVQDMFGCNCRALRPAESRTFLQPLCALAREQSSAFRIFHMSECLDLCCGTGDLLVALKGGMVLGSDFCHPMLLEARRKSSKPSV